MTYPSGMNRRLRHRVLGPVTAASAAVLVLAACGSGPLPPNLAGQEGHATTHAASAPSTSATVASVPLRAGEHFVELNTPAYTPAPPTGTGTDDYRCFLLDPALTEDQLVSGVDIVPQDPAIVHHVIVFQVGPRDVARAEQVDADSPGEGWTCFGGSGVRGQGNLDKSDWIGAWAPGGGERVMAEDLGIPLVAGTRVIAQVHYNTVSGSGTDSSRVRLRLTPAAGTAKKPLHTMLLPAPVELPCRAGTTGDWCNRDTAVADLRERFQESVATADLLHVLCGPVAPGPTQSCSRTVNEPMVLRASAGHMHLLGRSITVDVDKGTPQARRVLDLPVWDFDDQASRPLPEPVLVEAGHTLTVTCTHDQGLRDLLPAFAGRVERYVAWGEGTTDEMCLGIVLWTAP